MKRGRPATGGFSRNKDYYVKRLRTPHSSGMKSIKTFFRSGKEMDAAMERSDRNDSNQDDVCLVNENATTEVPKNNLETCDSDANNLTKNEIEVKLEEDKMREDNTFVVEKNLFSENITVEQLPSSGKKNSANNLEEIFNKKENGLTNVSKYEQMKYWVYYSPSAAGFLCKACSVMNAKGPWVSEGVNFHGHPTRAMKTHEESKMHQNSLSAIQSSKVSNVYQQIKEGACNELQKKQAHSKIVMKKFVMVIYFMIKKQWAILDNFESVIKFLGHDLGDPDIKLHLDTCAKNATYLSHFSVQNILRCISEYIEESSLAELKLCDAFTLFADESKDKAQREQLALIAKFKTTNGDVKEKFLGLVNLSETDAGSIMCSIEQFMLARGIDLSKCLFVSLDGTNVMSGEISGLQRRIKQKSPHCLYINCRNHRLALVFVHLFKKHTNLKSIDTLLISLWKMFHYSPQKYSILRNIQENVYNLESLKMLKVSTTRWLSHGHACARVSSRFIEIVETLDIVFEKTKEPEVKGVREQLLCPDVFLTILFLADLLKIVDRLNLWLQKETINFCCINDKVQEVIKDAEDLCRNLEEAAFFSKSSEFLKFAENATSLSRKLRKNQTSSTAYILAEFKKNFVYPFVEDFKKELKIAFEVKEDSPLAAFDVFVLDKKSHNAFQSDLVEKKWSSLISYYGEKKIDKFQNNITESEPIINKMEAKIELKLFEREIEETRLTFDIEKMENAKILLRKNEKEKANLCLERKITPVDMINIMERKATIWCEFPNLMKLLTLSVIIPSSTASVERLDEFSMLYVEK